VTSLTESRFPKDADLPEQIRVSTGTATVLGLLKGKLDAAPTTAYLMTYKLGKCISNCSFCPQARENKSSTELLSRVSWPIFQTSIVTQALTRATEKGITKRVCIQALNYPNVFAHLQALVKNVKNQSNVPISISCQPLYRENIELLQKAGVDRLGIALDAATEAVFNKVKGKDVVGSYRWKGQLSILREALQVFGKGNVSTHIIIGLGETEKEAAEIIQRCVNIGVLPALFAFTPVRGTPLERNTAPSVQSYRRIQLARYLIVKCLSNYESMQFDSTGGIQGFGLENDLLESAINSGEPFRTSGCQDCNRPFYNEKPSGPIYNYPQKPGLKEIEEIKRQFGAV
jgi:lipoyl synthase